MGREFRFLDRWVVPADPATTMRRGEREIAAFVADPARVAAELERAR